LIFLVNLTCDIFKNLINDIIEVHYLVFENDEFSIFTILNILLSLGEDTLLSIDLVLQVLNLLLRLGDVDRELEQVRVRRPAHVGALLHRLLVLLSQRLEYLDLVEQLVEQDERRRAELLVENLRVQVPGLDGHVYLVHEQGQLLGRRRPRAHASSASSGLL
jgi:hypothetical protein